MTNLILKNEIMYKNTLILKEMSKELVNKFYEKHKTGKIIHFWTIKKDKTVDKEIKLFYN